MQVIRMFDVFERNSDNLIDEIIIPNLDIVAVKSLVKLKKGDSNLFYQYEVKGKLKIYFENLGFSFKTDTHDYFLSYYQDN